MGTRLEDQATGRLVTADLFSRKSLDLFEKLVLHRFPDRDNSDLKDVCRHVSQAEEKRNIIVHSTWALAEEAKVMRVKTTAKGALTFCKMTAADVRAIAGEIHLAAEAVLNFYLSFWQPDHTKVTL